MGNIHLLVFYISAEYVIILYQVGLGHVFFRVERDTMSTGIIPLSRSLDIVIPLNEYTNVVITS